ncbi:MAG: YihY family inner membrane protein [Pseudomonadales bacterium]|nr:YihY family inner membrane protein [Pseudomonadales bacterium]
MLDQLKEVLTNLRGIMTWLGRNFVEDDCQSTAAALTYQTMFAVVPTLTVAFAMFETFEAFGGVSGRLEEFIFNNIVPETVGLVQQYVREFSQQARNLSIPSLLLLAITAFLMLFTIERTFNEIWRVKEPRKGYQRFLVYWAILTLGPVCVGLGFAITTYILSLPLVSDVADSPEILQLVPFALSTLMFTLVYVAVPNCGVPLRHGFIGGLIVALGFELAKFLFGLIMSRSNFQVIYGTFAAVPLFLLWVYISWTLVLLGAELVKAMGIYRVSKSRRVEDRLVQILVILKAFQRAHEKGDALAESEIEKFGSRINYEEWHEYRQKLIELRLIKPLDRGELMLSRDLRDVSLWELYQWLGWPLPERILGAEGAWEKELSKRFQDLAENNKEALSVDLESIFREEKED